MTKEEHACHLNSILGKPRAGRMQINSYSYQVPPIGPALHNRQKQAQKRVITRGMQLYKIFCDVLLTGTNSPWCPLSFNTDHL